MINNSLFIQYVKESFSWIEDFGFKFKNIEQNISFERVGIGCIESVSFSWAEYDRILVFGLLCSKRFNSIEKILSKAIDNKNSNSIRTKIKLDNLEQLEMIDNGIHLKNAFFISNQSDVRIFSKAVKSHLEEFTKFYEDFLTITNVVNWLKENEILNHSNLITSNHNTMMLRKLVIMKEAADIEFENLYLQYSSFLEEKNKTGESPYTEMYLIFIKLKMYFEEQTQVD